MTPSRGSADRGELREAAFLRGDEAASKALAEDVCDHAGHEFEDAGGGLEMCVECGAERWSGDA